MDNYSKSKLENMNYDRKYGSNWITNVNKIDDNQRYKLYATNDTTGFLVEENMLHYLQIKFYQKVIIKNIT